LANNASAIFTEFRQPDGSREQPAAMELSEATWLAECFAQSGSALCWRSDCLEEKLAELMSLGVRPGTADDVPPFVLAAAATVRLSAGAMRQLLLRFFLVPSSGYAQATTLLRRINQYLASQWLSISSTAALRNGPYGAIGEWAAKELPKAIVG